MSESSDSSNSYPPASANASPTSASAPSTAKAAAVASPDGGSAPKPADHPAPPRPWWRKRRWPIVAAGLLVVLLLIWWWSWRESHSITDDAFVEAQIINVAPESVSGRLVRCLVDENDVVKQGQVLAEIDPTVYRDQVELARSKVAAAEAELNRQNAALARLRLEVPIQIEIARRTLAAAKADQVRAKDSLRLTQDDVEHGIDEAQAGLDAASADFRLAQQDYERYTNLQKEQAVALRRAEEATQARDSADARRKLAAAKLATARANRMQIDVAQSTLNAAEKSTEKATEGVDLAETGNAQIHEMELLTEVKKESVAEAKHALKSAEDQLAYTQIRAPLPGVIVKRYRHLGDFASAGVPILSMYNPDLTYVTANLEETRLEGVAPGNPVKLRIDAFSEPFHGRVVWIDKSTGAQFS
ncbi:MAG TPA: HlyD family efflux transporter periplasmic adaptor subunit, partial [Pirellulales bacterium]|nr:HlyD family efflux transporter periplasmic adaptor subunit [Pirellulales bacterium]